MTPPLPRTGRSLIEAGPLDDLKLATKKMSLVERRAFQAQMALK